MAALASFAAGIAAHSSIATVRDAAARSPIPQAGRLTGPFAAHQILRGGPGMMVGDESIRGSAVDGRSRMSLVGQAPPCRSLIDEIRHASRRSLRYVYKHRRLPPLAATLAREGGRWVGGMVELTMPDLAAAMRAAVRGLVDRLDAERRRQLVFLFDGDMHKQWTYLPGQRRAPTRRPERGAAGAGAGPAAAGPQRARLVRHAAGDPDRSCAARAVAPASRPSWR